MKEDAAFTRDGCTHRRFAYIITIIHVSLVKAGTKSDITREKDGVGITQKLVFDYVSFSSDMIYRTAGK